MTKNLKDCIIIDPYETPFAEFEENIAESSLSEYGVIVYCLIFISDTNNDNKQGI